MLDNTIAQSVSLFLFLTVFAFFPPSLIHDLCVPSIPTSHHNLIHYSVHVFERLHLELEYSMVAVPFNSIFSSEPNFIFSMPNHFNRARIKTCCVSSYQRNLPSYASATGVGVKGEVRDIKHSLLQMYYVPLQTIVSPYDAKCVTPFIYPTTDFDFLFMVIVSFDLSFYFLFFETFT